MDSDRDQLAELAQRTYTEAINQRPIGDPYRAIADAAITEGWSLRPRPQIHVGSLLRGYCHGVFGRDSYDDKHVEAIGPDWVIVRETSGGVLMFGGSPEELANYTIGCGCGCQDEETDR